MDNDQSVFNNYLLDYEEILILLNKDFIVQTLITRKEITGPTDYQNVLYGSCLWDFLPHEWTLSVRPMLSSGEHMLGHELSLSQEMYLLDAHKQPSGFINLVITQKRSKQKRDFVGIQQQLGAKLAGGNDLDAILSAGIDACLTTTDMDAGGMYLLNPDQEELQLYYHKGLGQEFVEKVAVAKKGSDRWDLVMRGNPVYMEYAELPIEKDPSLFVEGIQSIAVLPLRYMGRVIGCINLASHTYAAVTPGQRSMLEMIVVQIGPAIDRVQQRQRMDLEMIQFRQIFDDLHDFFILTEPEGKILFVNQYLLTNLHYDREALINQSIFSLFHTESTEKIKQILQNYSQDQYAVDGISILAADGKLILMDAWVSMTTVVGEPVFTFWCRRSITDKKIPVLDSAANALSLYDDLPIPVLYVDPTTMLVLYANQFACDQYGYAKAVMMQNNFLQFFDSEAYHKIAKYLREYRLEEINRIVWNQVDAYGQKMRVRFFIRIIFRGQKPVYVIVPNPVISLEYDTERFNHDRYRAVLDQQTDVILRFSPEGIITYVNQAYCDFFNKSAQQVIGTSFMENVHGNDWDIIHHHLAQLTPERPLRESKNRMYDGEKNIRWFRWIDRAIYEGDTLVEIQGVGRDITEAEEEALKNVNLENQFRSLIDNSPVIIYFLDAKTLFPVYVNAQLEKLTGFSKKEFLSDSGFWKTYIHPQDYQEWINNIKKRQNGEQTQTVEIQMFTNTGEIIWLEDQGSLVEIAGQGFYIEGVMTDITQKKESAQKITMYRDLERLINQIVKNLVEAPPSLSRQVIQETITMIGQFMNIDRSYIFCFDKTKNTISNQFEWCAEGISPQRQHLQNIPISQLPLFYQTVFTDQQSYQIEDISQLNGAAEIEKQHFAQQEIKSLLVFPMVTHNEVIGFMGFDSVRKSIQWTEETVALLQVVSNLIVLVVANENG